MPPLQPRRSSLSKLTARAHPPDGPAPPVSVVLTTYNRASLVGRAIETALKQTFQDFELIVVDDGSKDTTADAVKRFDDPRLRYLRLDRNRGVSYARNAGIAEARGEWVAFLDDDDEWLPEKLERQLARVREDGDPCTGVVYTLGSELTKDGLRSHQLDEEQPEGDVTDAVLTRDLRLLLPSCMVRRSALLAVGGFDEEMRACEDTDLWLRLSLAGHRFAAVPELLFIRHFRYGGEQLTQNPAGQAIAYRQLFQRWGRLMRQRGGEARHATYHRSMMRRVREMNLRHVKRIEKSGDRAAAWRYVRDMLGALPWGLRYVRRALVVGIFGRPLRRKAAAETPPRRTSMPKLVAQAGPVDGPLPLVSVIIPAYNRAALIGRAIRSALDQTLRDIEVIVVDDHSTDGTVEVIQGFDDPRMRFIALTRVGRASHARNVGIANARGEWIAFLDDDDEWLPDRLERQLAERASGPEPEATVLYCPWHWVRFGHEPEVSPKEELAIGDPLDKLPMTSQSVITSTYMVQREAAVEAGGFDETLACAEDLDLWMRLAVSGHRFHAVAEPLVVKHDDHHLHQITKDAVWELHGMLDTEERWGKLMRKRSGAEPYQEWYRRSEQRIRNMHRRYVAQLIDDRDVRGALVYIRRMLPLLRWGRRYVARALVFGVLLGAPRALGHTLRGDRSIENRRSSLNAGASKTALDATTPAVSVVIPTYNRAALLQRAIESVHGQTFQDWELIVVDDGSRDETADIMRDIDDPRVQYVRLPRNRGVCHARNAGIAEARGTWIAFLDCDDEWLPEKLERQVAFAREDGDARVVYSRCYVSIPDGGIRGPRQPLPSMSAGDLTDLILGTKIPLVPSVYMVDRRALINARGFDETMAAAEDADLWLRLAQAGHRFIGVPEPLAIKHHDHELEQFEKDPITRLRWFRAMDQRWGPLMKERLGFFSYDRWRQNKLRRFRRRHKKYVKHLIRRGTRRDAWRYVREMLPFAVWGRRYVRKALKFALFGRRSKPRRPSKQEVSPSEASR